MNDELSIVIIGPGKVGTALAVIANEAGLSISAIGARNIEQAKATAARIGKDSFAGSPAEAARRGQLVLITVSDDSIAEVCDELAANHAFSEGTVVAHCSGVLSSTALASARDLCGCAVASMHPLHTFPSVEAALEGLSGAFCVVEGDDHALPTVHGFCEKIGLKPETIDIDSKPLYHASAVLACNYLCALMDASLSLAEEAGIDRETAWDALEPLVLATLRNIRDTDTAEALTGPIARGDEKTVSMHLRKLAHLSRQMNYLYRAMGDYTVELAIRKGTLSTERATAIRDLLREHE